MEKTSIFTWYTLKSLGRGWPMNNLLGVGAPSAAAGSPNSKHPHLQSIHILTAGVKVHFSLLILMGTGKCPRD